MISDDLALMRVHVETLFRGTAAGRLTTTNEPAARPAPSFWLGRTAAGNLWRYHNDLPDDLIAALQPMASTEPALYDPRQPALLLGAAAMLLQRRLGPLAIWQGPAYLAPATLGCPDAATLLDADQSALLAPFFPELAAQLADRLPCSAVLVAGRPVAVCFCARRSATAAEAGVETCPDQRRRGYGRRAVAAWVAAIAASGRLALYSTAWDNRASQGLARALGCVIYGSTLSFTGS